jgi:pyruvate dehydrogenase E2 component (dihydrolipoamide acetyltransferase)
MPTDIVVPQIGEAVSELRIVAWYKQVGDDVHVGDLLFEVDSDKAIVEVEAFVDGTLLEILAPADSAVMPQEVVARVATADEVAQPVAPQAPIRETPSSANISPVAQRMASQMGVSLAGITGSGPNGRITAEDVQNHAGQQARAVDRVLASPKARLVAQDRGVDLSALAGTGVDGLIVLRDVETAAPAFAAAGTVTPISKLRQTIAASMVASKQQVPHFYLMADVDMSEANRLRDYCRDLPGWERAPTYTDILIRACALSIVDMPSVNRSYGDAGFIERQQIGIGVAVAAEAGLIVPTLPDADQLSLQSIAENLRALAQRARSGRLKPADLGEKSMVISNLGMYGVDAFIAIIDMPDPMILAVGQVTDRLVPVDGQAVIKPMCTLSLSVDHRVLDGVQGAQFLALVKNRLENPFDIMG